MQDSDGHRTDYLYDAVGRLTGVWAPNYDYVAFAHDAGGRLLEKWFPNGLTARYAYNADDTVQSLTNAMNGTPLTSHVYTYDGAGRRQTQAETIGGTLKSWTYGYDNLDRLISANEGANTESYAYDYLNNRKTKTTNGATLAYLYDQANQLTEIRQGTDTGAILASLGYDNNGDLTSKTGSSPLTLTWDAEGKLQAANSETYLYDDQGRRIRKTVGATITNYLYNGPDIHAETSATNAIQAVYAHGPNWDDPLIRLTGQTTQPAANAAYYHQDGLNSSVATTDNLGTTTGTQRFDAWGNKTASTGTIPSYGYTGREPDATGLMFYRARYYDPMIGRFVSRDPAGMPDGVNRYAYVGNSPVNYTDPNGEAILNAAGAIWGGVSGAISGGISGWLTAGPNASDWSRVRNTLIGVGVGAAVGAASGAVLQPHLASVLAVQAATGVIGALVSNPATTAIAQTLDNKKVQPFENFTMQKLGPAVVGAFAGPAAAGAARVSAAMANSTIAAAGSLAGGTATRLLPLGTTGFENASAVLSGFMSGTVEGSLAVASGKQTLPGFVTPDMTAGGLFTNPDTLCITCLNNYNSGGFSNQGGKLRF